MPRRGREVARGKGGGTQRSARDKEKTEGARGKI